VPNGEEKREIFGKMLKHSDADVYNCASCEYNSCEAMAKAIHNGLNRPENCHHYQIDRLELGRKNVADILHRIDGKIDEAVVLMNRLGELSRAMCSIRPRNSRPWSKNPQQR
jgi:uncharacterized Fe-S cluster-containing protein